MASDNRLISHPCLAVKRHGISMTEAFLIRTGSCGTSSASSSFAVTGGDQGNGFDHVLSGNHLSEHGISPVAGARIERGIYRQVDKKLSVAVWGRQSAPSRPSSACS